MNKEEFIGKLEMVYVGDRNAIDEIISEYDRLNNIIDELEKWIEENIKISKAHDNNLGVNVASIFLDKLKELKENNNE